MRSKIDRSRSSHSVFPREREKERLILRCRARRSSPRASHTGRRLTWPSRNCQSSWCPSSAPPRTACCSSTRIRHSRTGNHRARRESARPWSRLSIHFKQHCLFFLFHFSLLVRKSKFRTSCRQKKLSRKFRESQFAARKRANSRGEGILG